MVTLRCAETPRLKLGTGSTEGFAGSPGQGWPGVPGYVPPTPQQAAGDVIVFQPIGPDTADALAPGYASFNEADFPLWREWAQAPGTPHIDIIDESTGLPVADAGGVRERLTHLQPQSNPLAHATAPVAPPAATEAPAKKPLSEKQIANQQRFAAASRAKPAAKQGAATP